MKKIDLKSIFKPSSAKTDVKKSHILQLILGLVIIIFLNVVGYYFFTRIDLTQEKRYTLSDSSKNLISNLEDIVFIRCYLEGDIPSEYKKLRNETKEMLDQFRVYNDDIEYEFINPNSFENKKDEKEFHQRLYEKGFSPLLTTSSSKNSQVQQMIFPYLEITYKGRNAIVPLISTKNGFSGESVINASIQNLEYNLYTAIRSVATQQRGKVAFLYGHGEWEVDYIWDFMSALSEYYYVDSVSINEKLNALTERVYDSVNPNVVKIKNKFDCLIVAKPTSIFSHKDLYLIDQYVMHGGKVLWLVDPLNVSMDSLQTQPNTFAISNFTGVDDILFRYGVKLNTNLVTDMQCAQIPLVTGQYQNNMPQMTLFPWNFFPEISPNSNHIISDKISPVKMEFVSSIDTTTSPAKKTILLSSSNRTRVLNSPINVSLRMAAQKQDASLFNSGAKDVAILLEGEFTSAYKNRLAPGMELNSQIGFKDFSDTTAMIVVADGDLVRNDFQRGQIIPLGYDKYTNQMYGNKEFLINCVNYLCGDEDLIPLRSREVIMRRLDVAKIEREKTAWQIVNVALPVVVILLFGIGLAVLRKKNFTKTK